MCVQYSSDGLDVQNLTTKLSQVTYLNYYAHFPKIHGKASYPIYCIFYLFIFALDRD